MKFKPSRSQQSRLKNANTIIPDLTNDVKSFIEKLPESPRNNYLKEQAWSKFVSNETDPPALRKSRALTKWLEQETRNAETNVRLAFMPEDYHILPRVHYSAFMGFLTSLVSATIGDVPPVESLLGGFSGGASTSRGRKVSAPALKFTGQAHITARAREIFEAVADEVPCWWQHVVRGEYLVPYSANHYFTVPKNTTIDRSACKEPDVNMFLQKGLGNEIRYALRRAGINLNDQSINQRLARQGSVDGSLATVDLSSASDSVTWELVFQIMPVTWFTLLDSTRSEVTLIGDEEHVNEMFSSMGNGFTFELESLIFWAIARTVCYFRGVSGIVSVYGDDIIVPTAAYDDLVWVLEVFGFRVNPDKSFASGPFRESCGGHYYNGVDITPFYIRRPVNSLVEAILLANNVRTFAGRDGADVLCPELLPLWEYIREFVPEYLRGGQDLGSTAQLVDLSEPSQRLVPVGSQTDGGLGGYLHWHCTNMRRLSEPRLNGWKKDLRIVASSWDPSAPCRFQDLQVRSYGYETSGEVQTSMRTETVEIYRLRKVRKQCDARPIIPWVEFPGTGPQFL